MRAQQWVTLRARIGDFTPPFRYRAQNPQRDVVNLGQLKATTANIGLCCPLYARDCRAPRWQLWMATPGAISAAWVQHTRLFSWTRRLRR